MIVGWVLIVDGRTPTNGYRLDGAARRLAGAHRDGADARLRILTERGERQPRASEVRQLADAAARLIEAGTI